MTDRAVIRKFLRDPGPTPPPGWTRDNPYVDQLPVRKCRYRGVGSTERLTGGGLRTREQAEVEFMASEFENIGRDDRLLITTRTGTREFSVDGEPQLPDSVLVVRVK